MNAWLMLAAAGLCEVGGAYGFQRLADGGLLGGLVFTITGFTGALACLHVATQSIALATAYGVFTAVGTLGSLATGHLLLGERITGRQCLWMLVVIAAIIGLRTSHV